MQIKQYNVWLDEDQVDKLDYLRIELKLNRSQLIRKLITDGLDKHKHKQVIKRKRNKVKNIKLVKN